MVREEPRVDQSIAHDGRARVDARAKATGAAVYAADVHRDGECHVAIVRSDLPHARILGIDASEALALEGVLRIVTAEDVSPRLHGRSVRDIPILARDVVRHVGERIAAVVATSRSVAERAASLVRVDLEPLPAVLDANGAVAEGAPLVHDAAWDHERAVVTRDGPANHQSITLDGDPDAVDDALRSADHVVDLTLTTPSGHAGYLEPHATVVERDEDGVVHVWVTDKSPYRLRAELSHCLGLDPGDVVVHDVAIGGDFGGKGSYGESLLLTEVNRLVGRPVRYVKRYGDDLTSPAPRHALRMRVRLGADADGVLSGVRLDVLADGGAYAGYKVRPQVDLHAMSDVGSSYRIPAFHVDSRIVYTNTVPRGHVRAPGAPQAVFAFETALDELALAVGTSAAEIRRRNLLVDGDVNPQGHHFVEYRGLQTLEAALEASHDPVEVPEGLRLGTGIAVYDRPTPTRVGTSLRLTASDDGGVVVEVPMPDTGTGSHTAVREAVARELDLPRALVRVRQTTTGELAQDLGVGGSRVTASVARAAAVAGEAWRGRAGEPSVTVVVDGEDDKHVTSFCVQVVRVGVDPESGQVHVLDVVTAVDVAEVLNPAAHQMQIDGGTVMGLGFALFEDLQVEDGRVWAASLGEFKIPTVTDVPPLRTVLVEGARGVGSSNVKAVGELSNVPTAAAISNAVRDAVGIRITDLPLRAESVWRALADGHTTVASNA